MKDPFETIHNAPTEADILENRRLLSLIFDERDLRGMRVLDVGCGSGGWSLAFSELGAKAIGLDYSWMSLRTAAGFARTPPVDLLQGSATNLPVRDGRADIVFSWGCLHYTPDPEQALLELLRACSPSGQVVVHGHRWKSFGGLHQVLRGLLTGLPSSLRELLLRLAMVAVRVVGRILGREWLCDEKNVRRKLCERWFYPGHLHSLDADAFIVLARRHGWEGERIPLHFPSRFDPENSVLLRLRACPEIRRGHLEFTDTV